MEENTENDHFETQSENPSEKNIPTNDNENMETHAHELHKAPGQGWKHYFFEFLMLFLAVFCGFLAENFREHEVERHREKEFIQSYVEDLKIDTAAISKNLLFQNKKKNQLDSLIYLLRDQKIKGYENELYYLGRILVRTTRFQSNDRTITQLKYSGSLRMIRNENAADSIISYQKLVDYILQNQEDERMERRAVDPILSRIFNPFTFYGMLDEFNNINKPDNNPPLRSYDIALQQDLAYYINQIKGSNILIRTRLDQLNIKAINIIAFLQKEYHLE